MDDTAMTAEAPAPKKRAPAKKKASTGTSTSRSKAKGTAAPAPAPAPRQLEADPLCLNAPGWGSAAVLVLGIFGVLALTTGKQTATDAPIVEARAAAPAVHKAAVPAPAKPAPAKPAPTPAPTTSSGRKLYTDLKTCNAYRTKVESQMGMPGPECEKEFGGTQ